MELELTEEQQQLCQTVREFAEREIAPHVREWDQGAVFPGEIIRQLGELGFLGIPFPESYGGAGLGYAEQALAIQELARVDPSVALTVAAHSSLCTNHIFQSGTAEQRQKYMPELA
ncbi:MAG: acyl-CoA dehydrogenase family protein, partial [Acidobacteria bacterium]|nr:acyl-CoA dehydrogenase family protein [Acidobacteriota bacterium]